SAAPKAAEPGSSAGAASLGTKTASDETSSSRSQQSSAASTPKQNSEHNSKPAAAPTRASGNSIVTHLTAGVTGGFLALLLADFVGPQFGLGTRTPPQVISDLQQRLTAAEQQMRERAEAPSVPPAELH